MRLFIAIIASALVTTGCSQQAGPPICTALYAYGLTVTTLDAATGDFLPVTPSGIARDGTWQDTMDVLGNRLMGAGERAGTYDIAVTAPGYARWDTTGITVTADECHVHGVGLTARLTPDDP
jgi:hypothetical protein